MEAVDPERGLAVEPVAVEGLAPALVAAEPGAEPGARTARTTSFSTAGVRSVPGNGRLGRRGLY